MEIFKEVKAVGGCGGPLVPRSRFAAADWQMRNLAGDRFVSHCHKRPYAAGPISKDTPISVAVPSTIGEPAGEADLRDVAITFFL